MCGIVGYTGKEKALPILINALKTLEYRGYDSAGIAVISDEKIFLKKHVGQVKNLEQALAKDAELTANLGIGHTRWATHGIPNKTNAHPHSDCSKRIFIVHNGIIENYKDLKKYLSDRGHAFKSETDTESVAHLIEDFLNNGKDFKAALF